MSDNSVLLSVTMETCKADETVNITAFLDDVHPIMITIDEQGIAPSYAHLTREMASSLSKVLSAAVEITPDFYKESANSANLATVAILAGNSEEGSS